MGMVRKTLGALLALMLLGAAPLKTGDFIWAGEPFGTVATQIAADLGENVVVAPSLAAQPITLRLVGVSPRAALHAAEQLIGATEVEQHGYLLVVPIGQAAEYGGDLAHVYPVADGNAPAIQPMIASVLGNGVTVQVLSAYSLFIVGAKPELVNGLLSDLEGHDVGVERVAMTSRGAKEIVQEMQALGAIPPMAIAVAEHGDGAIDIRGTAAARAQMRRVISRLDVPKPDVRFYVDVVSVSPETFNSVRGVLWGQAAQQSQVAGQIPTIVGGQVQTSFASRYIPIAVQINDLITEGKASLYKSTWVDMTEGDTVDVHVGENVPIVTQTGGALNPQSNVAFYPIGIVLHLRPELVSPTKVIARLDVNDSDILSISNNVPTVATSSVAGGTYTIKRGGAVVLIGYDQNSHSSTVQKIPVLGDLPLLGGLFRQRLESINKQHLIFVVRPEICPCGSTPGMGSLAS